MPESCYTGPCTVVLGVFTSGVLVTCMDSTQVLREERQSCKYVL
jgi:hypothetical protein